MSKKVFLGVGHGGTDPGAIGKDKAGKIVAYEKDINLTFNNDIFTSKFCKERRT